MRFKNTIILVFLFLLGGCELEPTDKQRYFENASQQQFDFQQTERAPHMYTVCGDEQQPCNTATQLHKKRKISNVKE